VTIDTQERADQVPAPRGRSAPLAHPSRAERVARGKSARAKAPLESHAEFTPSETRPDPVDLLLGQGKSRVPELVPIRHGRMLVSPFTFYRGAALPMAADLATTASAGLGVQLCGDAHLSNFGVFASPERRLVFDLNDFDETLPGPFEWDVKRLAASFAVATRESGFNAKERRKVVMTGVAAYRKAMREFAKQPMMAVWYAGLDIEAYLAEIRGSFKPSRIKQTEASLAKARSRDSVQAVSKLTTVIDGEVRFRNEPPLVVPVEDLFGDVTRDALYSEIRDLVRKYRRTLQSDRRHLLEQFAFVHMARKVVGVGSVGTRAWILLFDGGDGVDPLVLQAKEAQCSVLADYVGKSKHTNEGERVVAGQHLMQAVSDIFLGWNRATGPDGVQRDFYLRQLRDGKFSIVVEGLLPKGMGVYASACGWTLARAHARSGDRVAIAGYLGKSDRFETAISDFAERYADQNEADYAAFGAAVQDGRAESISGL
jgi:uncharacterized protein (DUF2252 family)